MVAPLRVAVDLQDRIGDLYCPQGAVIVPAPTHVRYGFTEGEIRRLTEYAARIRSDDRLLTIGLAPEAPLEWLDMLDDNEPSAEPFQRPDLLSAHFQVNATNVGLIIQAADPSWRNRKAGRVQEWAVPFVPIDTLSQHLDMAAPRNGRTPR